MTGYTIHALTHPPRRTYANALSRNKPGEPTELEKPRHYSAWDFRHGPLAFPVWDIPGDLPSPHGPIITDAFKGSLGTQPIAMWWAFLETENPILDAFYELNRADTRLKARAAVEKIHAPGLNIVWANASGAPQDSRDHRAILHRD